MWHGRRGRRGGALPVATLMKTFAVWRLAVWQLATACGTCNGQQQQQRDGNRDGNGDGVGNWSRVISHVMAVWQSRILLHPSISLSLSLSRPQSVVALCSGYGYGYGKWLQLRGLRPCDALEIVVAAPAASVVVVILLCCCFRCLTATG